MITDEIKENLLLELAKIVVCLRHLNIDEEIIEQCIVELKYYTSHNSELFINDDIFHLYVRCGCTDYNDMLFTAAGHNNYNMVNYMISLGATDLNGALFRATISNHISMVNSLILAGATDVNQAMDLAAEHGHITMVKHLGKIGADNYNTVMATAAIYNNRKIIDYMISLGAADWNNAMLSAISGGNFHLMQFFIKKGATRLDVGLISAVANGHYEIIDYLVANGIRNFEDSLKGASESGNLEMFKYVLKLGKKYKIKINLENVIKPAITKRHYDIIEYIISLNFDKLGVGVIISIATCNDDIQMIEYIVERCSPDPNILLLLAAKIGSKNVVDYTIFTLNAVSITEAISYAVSNDHTQLACHLLSIYDEKLLIETKHETNHEIKHERGFIC